MEIALLGYGKMGQTVERVALSKGISVRSKINQKHQAWHEAAQADTWIDFSQGPLVLNHVHKALEFQKNLMIGTTGWESDLPQIKELAKKHSKAILYAPNCSLGMLLFMKIVEKSASLMKAFEDYEVGGFEAHHKEKKDAPSGTGKKLSELLQKKTGKEVAFTSQRLGYIPGMHEVCFDGPCDSIKLRHEAKTREGFANGALLAAKWLEGKQGFFTLEEFIEEMIKYG